MADQPVLHQAYWKNPQECRAVRKWHRNGATTEEAKNFQKVFHKLKLNPPAPGDLKKKRPKTAGPAVFRPQIPRPASGSSVGSTLSEVLQSAVHMGKADVHERPSTAQGARSARDRGSKPAGAGSRPMSAIPPGRGTPALRQAGKLSAPTNGMLTTNEAAYGAIEFAPELFSEMLKFARPEPAQNLSLTSQWGDHLKKNHKQWAKQLKTTNQTVNDTVFQGSKMITYEEARAAGKEKFFNYVRQQRFYFGELLHEKCGDQIEDWLRSATPEEKSEFLSTFRDLYASANPNKGKSEYQVKYKGYRPSSAWGDRIREREENKARVQGFTKGVEDYLAKSEGSSRQGPRPGSGDGGSSSGRVMTKGAMEAQLMRSRRIGEGGRDDGDEGGPALMSIDTLKSSVPMRWVTSGDGEIVRSTYQDAHCGNFPTMVAQLRKTAQEKKKMIGTSNHGPYQPTAPYGKVNPVVDTTGVTRMPVPKYLLHPKGLPTGPGKWRYSTTNRICYMERSREALEYQAQKAREALERSQAERHRSSIPLGKQGLMADGPGDTTYQDHYKPFAVEVNNEGRNNSQNFRGLTAVY